MARRQYSPLPPSDDTTIAECDSKESTRFREAGQCRAQPGGARSDQPMLTGESRTYQDLLKQLSKKMD
jgi:hypothetical protein